MLCAPALTLRTCGVMPAEGASRMTIEAPPMEPLELEGADGVQLELVSRTFSTKRGPVTALQGMSLRAARNEVVAVVGPSGCGKSTLLELICGLQQPESGAVRCAPAALMPPRDL